MQHSGTDDLFPYGDSWTCDTLMDPIWKSQILSKGPVMVLYVLQWCDDVCDDEY